MPDFFALIRPIVLGILAALAALALGLALNLGAQRMPLTPAIHAAFESGGIESEPPPALSPYWLMTRAQADCSQLQPLVSSQRTEARSAVIRRMLRDREGRASPCALLGGRVTGGEDARIVEISRRTGMMAATSVTGPLLRLADITILRWFHLALLIALGGAAIVLLSRHPTRDPRLAAIGIGLAAAGTVSGIAGSVSLIPVTAVLLGFWALMWHPRDIAWWQRRGITAAALLGALLAVLDPSAGSGAIGLGLLILLLPWDATRARAIEAARPVLAYIVAALAVALGYALLTGIMGPRGGSDGLIGLMRALGDHPSTVWTYDLARVPLRIATWLVGGPLGGSLGLAVVIWTLPFALLAHAGSSGQARVALYSAFGALAPVGLWMIVYPGYLAREAQDYALLYVWIGAVAIAGPIALVAEWMRRNAAEVPYPSVSAEPDPANG